MDPVAFDDVAKLINLSPITKIELDAPLQRQPQWDLYRARHTIQRQQYDYRVLYLKAAASTADLREAHKAALGNMRQTDVVYAPSLATESKLLRELFNKPTSTGTWRAFHDSAEYLRLFLEQDLDQYARHLGETIPEPPFYVEPIIESPAGAKGRWDTVLNFLVSPKGVGEQEGQRLGVVVAEAGQGKTYHAWYMVSRLVREWRAQGKRLPIYIDSRQWGQLSKDDLASLAKTILHSFRYFRAPIAWVEGHEEEFLRTTLKLGLFTLIFDGLDEYVLWNGRVTAVEAATNLADMASSTTARIVATSRTSFWATEVASGGASIEDRVFVYKLKAFNPDLARNYFKKRLSATGADRAAGVFKELFDRDEAMAGRGFVLHLVADLFKDSDKAIESSGRPQENVVEWSMGALCERERERQTLPLTAEQQLGMLRELAAVDASKHPLDDELVLLAIQSASQLDVETATKTRGKLTSHPLISRDAQGRWRFQQDYVRNLLVAQHVDGLLDGKEPAGVGAFLTGVGVSDPQAVELAEVLVSVLVKRDGETGDRVKRLIAACAVGAPGRPATDARFTWALALETVETLQRNGGRAERAALLTSLLGTPGSMVRQSPWGTVRGFDFSGVTFQECVFEAVTFASCDFDAKTTFKDCRFLGGRDVNSRGLGQAQFVPQPTGDPEGLQWINARLMAAQRRRYAAADLRADVGLLLRKFVGHGGAGLRALAETDLRTGPLQDSPHCEAIIDAAKRRLLEEHHLAGGKKGLNVKPQAEEAMRFFGTNNNFTGPVQEMVGELQKRLGLGD